MMTQKISINLIRIELCKKNYLNITSSIPKFNKHSIVSGIELSEPDISPYDKIIQFL